MKQLLGTLVCLVPLVMFAGCGASVPEQKPPETAPELSPEEQQHMEQQIEEMRKTYQRQ